MSLKKRLARLFGGLLLLCFAGLMLVLSGCGSGSKSNTNPNQPLTVEGTWNITASETAGSSGFTANIVAQSVQSGNCVVDTPLGIQFKITGATTCFIADPNAHLGSINTVTGVWDYPPAGFLIGLSSANPVPANSTAQIGGFFVETDGFGVEIIDLNGTISASTKKMSGTFSCDAQSPTPCFYNGTFTAAHQ